jgi:hypothetical protein
MQLETRESSCIDALNLGAQASCLHGALEGAGKR